MKRPYDLVAFMQQEQRAEVLSQLKEEMSSKRFDETVDHVVEQTTAFDQVSRTARAGRPRWLKLWKVGITSTW